MIIINQLSEDLTQIARCTYYAKSLTINEHVEAQLDSILTLLGIREPADVGLSNRVLDKRLDMCRELDMCEETE